jgi:hypothetical protein
MRGLDPIPWLLALALALAAPATNAAPGWETLRTEDGIVVSRRDVAGSSFGAFRGEGIVNAPVLAVASVVVDVPRSKEWVDSVAEARVVRVVSPVEYIVYTHVATPVGITDRDFVTSVALLLEPKKKLVSVRMRSVLDPAVPETSHVRGVLKDSWFYLTSIDGGARTHVVAEIHADPRGMIPAFLTNQFQKNWGYNTLTSLRKQVAKRKGTENPRLKALLQEKGLIP